MHTPEIPTIVESLLFASGTPVSLRQLVAISGVPAAEVRAAVARLRDKYAPPTSGVHLVEVAGGYQLRTAPACAAYVKGLVGQRRLQLSRAAVETLAIIAYRQPVTRGEIEAVRGVTVEGVLTALLTQKLVQILGRKEDSGRPWVYGTTPYFLERFGLNDLGSLPPLPTIAVPTVNPYGSRDASGGQPRGEG